MKSKRPLARLWMLAWSLRLTQPLARLWVLAWPMWFQVLARPLARLVAARQAPAKLPLLSVACDGSFEEQMSELLVAVSSD